MLVPYRLGLSLQSVLYGYVSTWASDVGLGQCIDGTLITFS